jgi:hypothetical protein
MKPLRIQIAATMVAFVGVIVFAAASSRASVLTFDRSGTAGQFGGVTTLYNAVSAGDYPDYGDRVTWAGNPGVAQVDASAARSQAAGTTILKYGTAGGQTPNVVADYPTSSFVYIDGAANDFPQAPAELLNFADTTLRRYITLTADPGYAVSIQSFRFDTYSDADTQKTFSYVRVVSIDPSNVATTVWDFGTPDTGSTPVVHATGVTFAPGATGQKLAIEFQPISYNFGHWGLDDVQFSQIELPEPTSVGLVALACAISAMRRCARKAIAEARTGGAM